MSTMTRLNAPTRRHYGYLIFFLFCSLLFAAGYGAGLFVGAVVSVREPSSAGMAPTPFTAAELLQSSPLIQETWPMNIQLRIVDRTTFDRLVHSSIPGFSVAAFSLFGNGAPCQIVVPAGWPIIVSPGHREARWADPDNGETLAHEILHCLRGKWHPAWPAPPPDEPPMRKGDKR